jgi:hypothetical protein
LLERGLTPKNKPMRDVKEAEAHGDLFYDILELTRMIRDSVTIDWTQRESMQAEIRLKVKKILRKYGYPPDREKKATETVLRQAEVIAKNWVAN